MARLFYDHLIQLSEVEILIKQNASSKEEQEELWNLVEDIIHHKVLHTILDHLPRDHHNEFLEEFTKAPHDERHIQFLNDKSGKDIEDVIQNRMGHLEQEILSELKVASR